MKYRDLKPLPVPEHLMAKMRRRGVVGYYSALPPGARSKRVRVFKLEDGRVVPEERAPAKKKTARIPRLKAAPAERLYQSAKTRKAWIAQKIAQLRREHYPERQAVAIAFHEAMRPYVERGQKIPADLLPAAMRPNPKPQERSGRAQRAEQAMKLYMGFREQDPQYVEKFPVEFHDVGVVMGKCTGIIYGTTIRGKVEKFIHQFKIDSAPKLVASYDGSQLYLLGGSYQIGPRGIVDK